MYIILQSMEPHHKLFRSKALLDSPFLRDDDKQMNNHYALFQPYTAEKRSLNRNTRTITRRSGTFRLSPHRLKENRIFTIRVAKPQPSLP